MITYLPISILFRRQQWIFSKIVLGNGNHWFDFEFRHLLRIPSVQWKWTSDRQLFDLSIIGGQQHLQLDGQQGSIYSRKILINSFLTKLKKLKINCNIHLANLTIAFKIYVGKWSLFWLLKLGTRRVRRWINHKNILTKFKRKKKYIHILNYIAIHTYITE